MASYCIISFMRIVVDIRERGLFDRIFEALLHLPEDKLKQIDVVTENLPIGDILIQNADKQTILIIERKTYEDMLASIKDGRYEEQSHRLTNTSNLPPHSIIYLLEGVFSNIREPVKRKMIYSAMASCSYFKGFSVMKTASVHETGEWIVALTEKIGRELEKGRLPHYRSEVLKNTLTPQGRGGEGGEGAVEEGTEGEEKQAGGSGPIPITNYCNFVKKVKKDNVTPENIGEIVLSQIPGISNVTAITIMKKFSTFPQLLAALRENPDSLNDISMETNGKQRKISKSSIENIKKYFL
jgi:ERCC4-type nuclease